MVIFNPQVPDTNTPDWTNTTRPISQPEADKSKGMILSAIGSGLEGGAKIAEDAMQDYLKDKVSAGVNALRDTSILAYQDIRNSQVTGSEPAPTAVRTAGFKGSLSQPNANSDIPEDLQSGLTQASNIALAKSQRGAANDTLYTAQLYALAKQLRAEYPGHKDFIDQQIARISGKDPANAYMANLLSDINHASSGQDVFQKQILTKAAANMGDAEVQKWWVATQQGLPNGMKGLTNAVFKAEEQKAKHERWKMQNEETKGDQAADADIARGQWTVRSAQIVDKHMAPVLEIPGLTTPEMMKKLVNDSNSGKMTLSTVQKDQLLSAMVAARSQAADDLQRTADSGGYNRRIRDPASVDAINTQKLGMFDRTIEDIKNNSYGSLFEAQRRSKAMQDDTNVQVNTSNIGEWLRQRSVFTEKLGPNWMNYLDSLGISQGKLKELQSFFNDSQFRASVADDVRKDGVVKSMYNDLLTAKNAKARGANAPDAIYDNLVDNVNLILRAQQEGREDIAKEVVKYTFDPAKNQRIVEFFGKDFVDDKGRKHNGREAVYDTLTQPKIVDSIWNLKDPTSWRMHKEWQEISFKTIFGEQVKDLERKMNWTQMKDTDLNWDSDNNRFFITGPAVEKSRKFDPNVPPQALPADVANVRILQSTLDGVNRGLGNLGYMRMKEGNDVNSYLFDVLLNMGYSPNDRLRGDNLPQRAVEAIAASSKSNQKRIEDAFRASSGSSDARR